MKKTISILGSTGSIGQQSLQVCRNLGYQVAGLAANRNVQLVEEQVREFNPRYVCMSDEAAYRDLKVRLADTDTQVLWGVQGMCDIAQLPENDLVLNSVMGMVGLEPTLAAVEAGKDVALANKETLVAGGKLVMDAVARKGVRLLPVDSEHSAIFQCLQAGDRSMLRRIFLTASGGPFFGRTRAELEQITVEQALKHPNWTMGAKITIDSATLMNKGLEVIEAVWLFDVDVSQIQVLVHRESVVHSAVEFVDGSVIAQLGVPDMRIPIQYALTYPARVPSGVKPLSLLEYGTLSFAPPDLETFPCLQAAVDAMEKGGLYPCVVNGANEAAVALFLAGKISFLQIGELVQGALSQLQVPTGSYTLEELHQADAMAREYVKSSL